MRSDCQHNGKDNKENPIQIVNNLHNYDDDWNYPQQ